MRMTTSRKMMILKKMDLLRIEARMRNRSQSTSICGMAIVLSVEDGEVEIRVGGDISGEDIAERCILKMKMIMNRSHLSNSVCR
jgi:hypothetical protein